VNLKNKRNLIKLLVLTVLLNGCGQKSAEDVERIIAKSETLRHIDQICKEFPRPESFELQKKGLSGNSITSIVFYQYTAHVPFDEVKKFYQDSGLRAQYELRGESYKEPLINEIWFRRGDVGINIENRPPSWIVNIGCSSKNK
jgi:hypothetical protein